MMVLKFKESNLVQAVKLVFVCMAVLAAIPARAGLIINGSFEFPTVPTGSFTNFPGGSTAITGWRVVGIDSAVVNTTFTQSGITFQAQDGNQWIDLAGVTSNSMLSGVTQDVQTMIGTAYELSFYVGSATDGVSFFPSTVSLSIDGGVRMSFTNPTAPNNMLDWKLFTVPFTAQNSTTTLTIFNGGASNNFLTGVDNVSLTAVPEPSSLMLSLIGLSSVGFVIRARRNASRVKKVDRPRFPQDYRLTFRSGGGRARLALRLATRIRMRT